MLNIKKGTQRVNGGRNDEGIINTVIWTLYVEVLVIFAKWRWLRPEHSIENEQIKGNLFETQTNKSFHHSRSFHFLFLGYFLSNTVNCVEEIFSQSFNALFFFPFILLFFCVCLFFFLLSHINANSCSVHFYLANRFAFAAHILFSDVVYIQLG